MKKLMTALAMSAFGITTMTTAAEFEGNGYTTDSGLKILPLLVGRLEHNDNVGRYSNAESPDSSGVFVIEPGIVFQSDRNGNQYQVAYQISSGKYFDSKDDDFVDHSLSTNNKIFLNTRNAIAFNYAYLYLHEERGTGIAAGDSLSTLISRPVKYAIHSASVGHTYGSRDATGRIETTFRIEDKKYINYRTIESSQFSQISTKFKDYFEYGGSVAFYYKAMPATSLLFEIDVADRSYDLNDPITDNSQDSLDVFYLTGVTWEITGKTTGKVRFGLQDKSYEDSSRADFSGFSWDLDVEWKPVSHSTFTASAAQRVKDPDQGFNYVDETSFDGIWRHYWLNHVYTNTSLQFVISEYSVSKRSDDLIKFGFSAGYELRDYVELSAGWRYEDNDSSLSGNSYDQNVLYMSANVLF